MDAQLKKGILELCVLHAISWGESYGYKIINDLNGVIEISESTLYPILKRLESGGFIFARSVEYNGRLRRYYRITASGVARLRSGGDDLKEIIKIYNRLFGGNV